MRQKNNFYTRSPNQELTLIPPFVPVADEADGLIKTADLVNDIIVEFPVWEGARLQDSYQLQLNGDKVGLAGQLVPLPPVGTLLRLTIPVDTELKDDGAYKLDYLTIGYPSGTEQSSQIKTIIVDRTAPGAHQLGYMDFPAGAKDGLTLEELQSMGGVLTGSIFGYSGLNRGDVIKTYWGNVPGPELELNGLEDESQAIEILFTQEFLTALGSPAGATYYTVTDRAGNTSAESQKITIPLFLTDVTPGLPAPVIDNNDGVIDYAEAMASVEVKIPFSSFLMEGDQILLHWGSEELGPASIAVEDLDEPFILFFDVPYLIIEQAQSGLRDIKYYVIRNGQITGTSDPLEVLVNIELPVPGVLDKPTIKGSSSTPSNEDNFIDENDFELDATVLINWNPLFKANQILTVFWGGQEVLEQPYTLTNSDVVAGRTLLLTALNSKFTAVGTGNDIRVYYTVKTEGNPNLSTSSEQGLIVRSKNELPGGPDGPEAPQFMSLSANGTLTFENSAQGAPIFIQPYLNMAPGHVIVFTYEAYNELVGDDKKFEWSVTSPALTQEEVQNGVNILVPRTVLNQHCYGHAEISFQVRSSMGQGNSKRASAYVDMRVGGLCRI
ncbi:hypothetical protein ABEH63_25400 [Pseudomonas syringae]|uniref:Uncharacterized protein n=1 Tax=Pseudomonas syringae UB303 TaxID=1357287 RepID=A0AAJ4BAG5_PSESX|nr:MULTISPECIES: hypothetical protein [Pseudomonas]MCA5969824.1 hypothetical protein [Pseudomonas sp. P129]MCA5970849.1 hypothetical protein [Pseudomonas sp. P135]MCH5509265.1 hypothetical protein [Pseudomonas syringae pv. syringae]MCH5534728.1 hypothetical protein [Pseudomonas syringae pv. syringae]MCH5569183.1 hypothetical protein [Pseudomonas syringae pv. syringae]